ncbi:MAG: SLC13 family permease [Myxococcota bacterium]
MHAATSSAHLPLSVTLIFLALLVAMVGALAFEEKLHAKKSVITGVFAFVSLLLGSMFGLLHPSEHSHLPLYIPMIDWSVIVIIFGSSLFIDVTSRSGIFTWTAVRLTKLSKGDPVKLLWYYAGITVVFSAVLNNVTAMIIVGSLSGVSLRKLGRENLLLGFLLTEGLLTNIGGLLTLISSIPNIIVGTAANINFVSFLYTAAPYVLITTLATLFLAQRIFRIEPLADAEARREAENLVRSFDENESVESPTFFAFSWALLGLFILGIATASVTPYISDLGMGFVAMGFAVIALVRLKHEPEKAYVKIDWDLLLFFAYLFIVIHVMEGAQVLALIGDGIFALIGLGETLGPAALLWSSALASSVTDNVPLAAVLAKILTSTTPPTPTESNLWWATIFGCNLGGNFTPIGSASTLVAVAIIHKNKLPMSFGGFIAKAAPFAIVQLLLATVYVLLFL